MRFLIFTGLGAATDMMLPTGLGTAMGLALGAFDSLVLDNLLRGWRPNQFVDGPLAEWVGKPQP
jgi:hypothetical protein